MRTVVPTSWRSVDPAAPTSWRPMTGRRHFEPVARPRGAIPIADWLSEYRGAWQELFPNAGAACTVLDVPLPFHGEVSTARWDVDGSDRRCRSRYDAGPAAIGAGAAHAAGAGRRDPAHRGDCAPGRGPRGAVPLGPSSGLRGHRRCPHRYADRASAWQSTMSTRTTPTWCREHGIWPDVPGRTGGMVDVAEVGTGPHGATITCPASVANGGWAAIRGVARLGLGVAMAWDIGTFPMRGSGGKRWAARASVARPSRSSAIEPQHGGPSDGLAAAVEPGQAPTCWSRVGHIETWLTGQPVRCRRPAVRVSRTCW